MDAVEYLDLLLKSLLLAGVYSAMAVGMTVIYGVMKIVNLAHAGFLMLGAYFALELFQFLAQCSPCRFSFFLEWQCTGFWCAGFRSPILPLSLRFC
jgi:branched-subunit amino acid ABC-type transport system permease component